VSQLGKQQSESEPADRSTTNIDVFHFHITGNVGVITVSFIIAFFFLMFAMIAYFADKNSRNRGRV
jgi:hypothetical protein